MAYVGLQLPNEPVCDDKTYDVITTFWLADRGRNYLSGMAVMPLPLTVQNISEVVAVYPVAMERHTLDQAVFAIDDEYLAMVNKKQT